MKEQMPSSPPVPCSLPPRTWPWCGSQADAGRHCFSFIIPAVGSQKLQHQLCHGPALLSFFSNVYLWCPFLLMVCKRNNWKHAYPKLSPVFKINIQRCVYSLFCYCPKRNNWRLACPKLSPLFKIHLQRYVCVCIYKQKKFRYVIYL